MIDCYVGSTQPAMDRTFEVDATRSLVATQQNGTGSALSSSAVSTGGGGDASRPSSSYELERLISVPALVAASPDKPAATNIMNYTRSV